MAESGDFLIPLREGRLAERSTSGAPWANCCWAGSPDAPPPTEITVYESLGLAVEDIACAEALCRPAAKL